MSTDGQNVALTPGIMATHHSISPEIFRMFLAALLSSRMSADRYDPNAAAEPRSDDQKVIAMDLVNHASSESAPDPIDQQATDAVPPASGSRSRWV